MEKLYGEVSLKMLKSHLLSVVTHQLGITFTQRPVSDKTNEIPVASCILDAFDVAGKVVTTDALLTQRSFCQDLCNADADYVQPIKENQSDLLEDIRSVFETKQSDTLHHTPQKHLNRYIRITAHIQILIPLLKREWVDPNAHDDDKHTPDRYRICGVARACSSLPIQDGTETHPNREKEHYDAIWHNKSNI